MDSKTDSKRKMDKHSDNDDRRREKRSRRHRSRSRSYEDRERDRERRKRRHSRSRSPNGPVKQEKRDDAPTEPIKKAPERKAKETDMLNTRTGGAYIPPARLRMMQAQITDKSSVAYQRLAWEALKKSIHGHINKINVGNIGIIIRELLKENIVRGRGLLCRSVIQAQAASPTFTNVYAALVAAVNSRFPNIGELLLKRLVIQFKRGFKRNDKPTCISSASFIAHLVNQRVAHEILALELLTLLVESPTDDSVEVAIAFLKECGQKLTEVSSKGVNAIFEMLRNILHEGQLDKRVQYMIEVMFQVWKDGFKDHPALIEELELVAEEEQFTHLLMLDDATDPQDILNVFKFDDKYEDNEQKYKTLSKEILGSDAESGEEDGSGESGSEESDDEDEQEGDQKGMTIIDNTETNLVALRRTIYLTINSSLDFEECAHKLMKMQLKPGQEVELCHMFLDCCAEQRTYEKFYGLLAQRFCNINRMYIGPFEEIYKDSYATAHRLDTNRLRNVSKFFAHLLFTDSISWEVMECVKLNEEDTTSSSRIYIKILFQELAEYMGLKKLNDRLRDPTLQDAFSGIFPRDNPKNTRFSINFFTSIGLGGLTDELREHLKQMPKNVPAAVTNINVESDSSSSDSSSSSSSSDSSSDTSSDDSDDENEKNKKSEKSKEKKKSKQSKDAPSEDTSNKENNDKDKRWGHDGFYDTYGENAQRYENRQDRSEQNRDNFARPRDVSRRYEDRDRHSDSGRGNTEGRNNRDSERRRYDRSERQSEEVSGKRADIDTNQRRPERERARERRDSGEYRRNERNTKDDSRGDNGTSRRDQNDRYERSNSDNRSRRDDREDRRQDKDRNRSNDEHSTNRSDRADDRTRDQNNKKDSRDKDYDKNDKVLDNDRNKDKSSKDSLHSKTKDKNMGNDNRESRVTDVRDKGKKGSSDKRDKQSEKSDDDDSRKHHKEDRSKVNRRDDDNKYKETERNRREDKGKSNKDNIGDRSSAKDKNKKNGREKEDSSDESEDENRKEKNNTKRTKEINKHRPDKSKKNKNDSDDDDNSKNRSKKNNRTKYEDKRKSSPVESGSESSDDEGKTKRYGEKEKRKQKVQDNSETKKGDSKDRKNTSKKQSRKKKKEKESSSDSSESDSSSNSSDYENNKTSGRYWDTFDINNKDTLEKGTKRREKSSDKRKGH